MKYPRMIFADVKKISENSTKIIDSNSGMLLSEMLT